MSAKKVLFITQEITPYVPESELSLIGQNLPTKVEKYAHSCLSGVL